MKLVNTLLRFYDHEMSGEIKYMIEEHFNYDVNVDKVEVGYVDVSFWGNGNCEIDILLNTGKKLLDKSQRDYVRVLVLNYIFTVLSSCLSQAGVKISDDVMYFDEEVYNYFEDIKIEIKNETNKKVATHLKFYDNLSSIPKYKDLSYYEDSVKEFSKEIKKKVVVVKVSHTTQPCSSSNMKKREDIGEGYYEDESGNILHDLVHRPKKEEPISLSQMKGRSTFYKEIKEIVEKVLEENRVQSEGRKRRKAPYVKIRDEILMEENRREIIEERLNRDKPCEEPEIHELNGLPINHCDYFIARGWLRDYIDLMKSYLYADCDVIRVKKHIEKSTKKLNKINKKILKDIKKKEERETKEHNRNVWKA